MLHTRLGNVTVLNLAHNNIDSLQGKLLIIHYMYEFVMYYTCEVLLLILLSINLINL